MSILLRISSSVLLEFIILIILQASSSFRWSVIPFINFEMAICVSGDKSLSTNSLRSFVRCMDAGFVFNML